MSARRLPLDRIRELHAIARSMNTDDREVFGPQDEIDVEEALAELIELRQQSAERNAA